MNKGMKWGCLLAAAACTIVAGGCSNSQGRSAKAGFSKPVPVHVYTVAEELTRRRIQAVGSLLALEESTLSAQVEGRVDKVLVDVGDTVTKANHSYFSISANCNMRWIANKESLNRFGLSLESGLLRRFPAILRRWPWCSAPKPIFLTPTTNTLAPKRCSTTNGSPIRRLTRSQAATTPRRPATIWPCS